MSFITTHRVRRISGVISTDDIIPARYKHMHTDPEQLAPHLFEAYQPGFAATLAPGDALVSDSLFGIGSSREQAISTLLANGVGVLFAPAFGRILFRNAWNLALPAVEIDTAPLEDGSQITVDLLAGEVRGEAGVLGSFPPPAPFLLEMVAAGGLLNQVKATLAAQAELAVTR